MSLYEEERPEQEALVVEKVREKRQATFICFSSARCLHEKTMSFCCGREMDDEYRKGLERHQNLLGLMPRSGAWSNGFREAEERNLELRLGPPGDQEEGWVGKKTRDEHHAKPSLSLDLKQPWRAEEEKGHERKGVGCSQAKSNTCSQTKPATTPVVGWPPIRSFRRNLASSSKPSLQPQNGGSSDAAAAAKLEDGKKGLFVKINMDGVPIGRKVDLKAYDSYDKLSSAVDLLFRGLLAAQRDPSRAGTLKNAEEKQAITNLLDGSGEYTLVYEDDEGDRMLVGDVPWDMFISTVKRLRVLRSSDLSESSLRTVRRKRAAAEC